MITSLDNHFTDLDNYLTLPRLSGLRLAPDGRRLIVGAALPDAEKNRFTTSLWEIDTGGGKPPRRLTHGPEGESEARFLPNGDLLFMSKRPGENDPAALWRLSASGGEAELVTSPAGGVRRVLASKSGAVVLAVPVLPSATDLAHDKELRKRRKDAGVTAILHEEFPIRLWDHHLGPDRVRLVKDDRDITGHIGRALDDFSWDISADGGTVVAVWAIGEPGGSQRYSLMAIDVATGERRLLADDPDHEYLDPKISPDGTTVACVALRRSSPEDTGDRWLATIPLAGGQPTAVAGDWDRWPKHLDWTTDGTALIVAADDHGRSPLWRVDIETGQPARLTEDHGAYSDIQISPDGQWVYALRAAIDSPPSPVRISLTESTMEFLASPVPAVELPGRLEEVSTTAADGTPLRAWIALPHHACEADKVQLLLWIHGGPYLSHNTWQWRWNPWLAVAQGYAVLLPDPALSTGYGTQFVRRGWGNWGDTPYTDLMAITDAAEQRPDINPERVAAMGASFGGYLANWIAGHTDRFAAIVTHASIWSLEQEMQTTDMAHDFPLEMTAAAAMANSPHRFADDVRTPMLVIHGDRDHRVPIGEALRLWWDLSARAKTEDSPHKFLYFPDENHWILKPEHIKVWYSTVFAFLATHLRDTPWQTPQYLS